jgi:hypothetical protein
VKQIFEPSDFPNLIGHDKHDAVLCAKEKLAKLIEGWPVVWFNDDKTMSPYWEASSRQDKKHTHKAYLAFIEPIKREPCKHEPEEYEIEVNYEGGCYSPKLGTFEMKKIANIKQLFKEYKCKHCGISLEATWKEKV